MQSPRHHLARGVNRRVGACLLAPLIAALYHMPCSSATAWTAELGHLSDGSAGPRLLTGSSTAAGSR